MEEWAQVVVTFINKPRQCYLFVHLDIIGILCMTKKAHFQSKVKGSENPMPKDKKTVP